MPVAVVYGLSALAALVPAWLYVMRGGGRVPLFWALLVVALAGPVSWAAVQLAGRWQTGFSTSLWVTIAVSIVIFAAIAAVNRAAWRLTPLLLPYLLLLGALAMIWQNAPGRPLSGTAAGSWLVAHIVVSELTYALITLAAIAGLAILLQERALKDKRPTTLSRRLPAVADAERLQVGLLVAGEAVLGAGLVTGFITLHSASGTVLQLDHKMVLAIVAFVVIGTLLGLHFLAGMRGRRAARLILIAYLIITLAYPGVKFVTDVLVGGSPS
ncbi:MAG: cytochrome c biogenesis protein CcsA [Alphaproteobacteria bacterium]|nr:cytochrome c biogenesis protein CcsA [Alphaproteobacteria bacterium]